VRGARTVALRSGATALGFVLMLRGLFLPCYNSGTGAGVPAPGNLKG